MKHDREDGGELCMHVDALCGRVPVDVCDVV